MVNAHKVVNELLDENGVDSVYVNITIKPVVTRRDTGEESENYQPIRKRVASKSEIESLLPDEMSYHGEVDVMGDFRVKDKAIFTATYEDE